MGEIENEETEAINFSYGIFQIRHIHVPSLVIGELINLT
jgi:hypothetical protein